MANLSTVPQPALRSFVEGAVREAAMAISEYEFREAELKSELQAAITEYEFRLRWLRIELWRSVGCTIRDWRAAAARKLDCFVPLEPFCKAITETWGKGKESGYKAAQIAKHFPTEESLNTLPFGKAASVGLLVNKVIPALNAGETLDEIAMADRKEMDKRRANKPRLLYEGSGIMDKPGDRWAVELPQGQGVKAWRGDEVKIKVWEQNDGEEGRR